MLWEGVGILDTVLYNFWKKSIFVGFIKKLILVCFVGERDWLERAVVFFQSRQQQWKLDGRMPSEPSLFGNEQPENLFLIFLGFSKTETSFYHHREQTLATLSTRSLILVPNTCIPDFHLYLVDFYRRQTSATHTHNSSFCAVLFSRMLRRPIPADRAQTQT